MYRKYTVQLTECGKFSNGKLNAKSLVQAVALHHVVIPVRPADWNALGMHITYKHFFNHSGIFSHPFVIGNANCRYVTFQFGKLPVLVI